MKKIIVLLGALALVAGCNKDDETATTDRGTVYRESAGANTSIEMSLTNNASTNGASTNSSSANESSTAPDASQSRPSTTEPQPNSPQAK